ncbi:unnamed protein product [Urochloa humidicola]
MTDWIWRLCYSVADLAGRARFTCWEFGISLLIPSPSRWTGAYISVYHPSRGPEPAAQLFDRAPRGGTGRRLRPPPPALPRLHRHRPRPLRTDAVAAYPARSALAPSPPTSPAPHRPRRRQPRSERTIASHLRCWLVGKGGNPNHQLPASRCNAQKVKKIDVERVRYYFEEKHKSDDENINMQNEELVQLYNVIAEARCDIIDQRNSKTLKEYQPEAAVKKLTFIQNKLTAAINLRRQVRAADGKAIPLPPHFKKDP